MTRPTKLSQHATHESERDSAVQAAIVHRLAQPPAVSVPDEFAARVALRAASQPQARIRLWPGWGPRLMLASGGLLTAGMFALAPHTAPSLSNFRFDAELMLFAELSGLALFARRLLQE